ncbi:MAG: ATP-binding cassette domain-containing protein [Armatimonadetes bacterium]|nr:ATP-binding cassette domain-containing protein [Armatimonadota bacterium]
MIETRGLSIQLGEFSLKSVDVQVETGEYFVLLGPTGAGKTVLIECIAGLHRPAAGEVWIEGVNVSRMTPEERNVSYVPQDYGLFPHLRVYRNIAFGLALRKTPPEAIQKRVHELTGMLGIDHLLDRYPGTLSGGEKQRVSLARALAPQPQVLLLDEPLSALDERTREAVSMELKAIQRQLGTTTLHISHNFEETLAVADRIGIFREGRIAQTGTADEVFRKPRSRFVAEFVRADNIYAGEARPQGGGWAFSAGKAILYACEGVPGKGFFTIRPEEVTIGASPPPESGSCLHGRLRRVVDRGPMVRIDLDAAVPVASLMLKKEWQAAGLAAGDDAYAWFDPGQAYIFQEPDKEVLS